MELRKQRRELMGRNKELESLREDLSMRLAKGQDAYNLLRTSCDKLVAIAAAVAEECAATQHTSEQKQKAALDMISEVRTGMRVRSRVLQANPTGEWPHTVTNATLVFATQMLYAPSPALQ